MSADLMERILLDHIDGDFLVGCGRSIGNEGGDVAINKARPSEVAAWAAEIAQRYQRTSDLATAADVFATTLQLAAAVVRSIDTLPDGRKAATESLAHAADVIRGLAGDTTPEPPSPPRPPSVPR